MRYTTTLAILAASFLASCGTKSQQNSAVQFDSPLNIALDGTIDSGRVLTSSTDDATITAQIKDQLAYSIGHLNTFGGGIDLSRVAITIKDKQLTNNQAYQVTYSAKALISWPREYQVPASYNLLLPLAAYSAGLNQFLQYYGADEHAGKRCLDDSAKDISTSNFWYYYRPLKASCPLRTSLSPLIQYVPIRLAVSAQNTANKYPEYGKVWEDGKLIMTVVYGKADAGTTTSADFGINAFIELYDTLIRTFGRPMTSSLAQGQRPSVINNHVRLTFRTTKGVVDVALFLVDSVPSAGDQFIQAYQERSMVSDYIAYGGHAGLGDNVRALVNMGRYTPGQYQVFLMNGCDTFSYIDDKLRLDHQAVNPGSSPDKYVDIITNARPSYFNTMTRAVMNVAVGLHNQTLTYRQILAGFEQSQRAAVMGEQDNRWPAPF